MELTGKIIKINDLQTGTGKNGEWKKQDFVIEIPGTYPKKVCLAAWGDRAQEVQALGVGMEVKASIDIESREYNGKWYTDVKVWKLERVMTGAINVNQNNAPSQNNNASPFENSNSNQSSSPFDQPAGDPSQSQEDDLPF